MANPKKSTPQGSRGTPDSIGGSENWVMKAISDLREDVKDSKAELLASLVKIDDKIDKGDDRIGSIEKKISRLIWTTAGIGIVLTLLFGGYELLNTFFDVNMTITSKEG